MYIRNLLALVLVLGFVSGVQQSHATGVNAARDIGRHVADASPSLVVAVATSALTTHEKRALRKIKSHSKKMRGLSSKMNSTTKRLKRINAKMKR